jgi:hypothetical protein
MDASILWHDGPYTDHFPSPLVGEGKSRHGLRRGSDFRRAAAPGRVGAILL